MKAPQVVIAAVVGLVLLGGGFAAGMTVGKGGPSAAASAPPSDRGSGSFVGGQGAGGRGAGGQFLNGRIIAVNDGSLTVEVRQPGQNGASPTVTSAIVLVGSTTRVVRTTETDVKLSDLKANDSVQIVGTPDTSGSVSASAIVVGGNALGGLFGGQGGAGGGPGRGAGPSPSPTR